MGEDQGLGQHHEQDGEQQQQAGAERPPGQSFAGPFAAAAGARSRGWALTVQAPCPFRPRQRW